MYRHHFHIVLEEDSPLTWVKFEADIVLLSEMMNKYHFFLLLVGTQRVSAT